MKAIYFVNIFKDICSTRGVKRVKRSGSERQFCPGAEKDRHLVGRFPGFARLSLW
jgi:hypothetical protein